ncbi:transporter [Elysia marginata]|uniref:Transporter n=1 Tax=Elysia marginata TaxID=1093978 RepID=A0AAV4G4E6_9GAST|nr:transporter [Elysia marginata]
MWAFGILGLLHFDITILTALIPPLIIVIGIPNCIFLINKYQQEVKKHGNQAKSLQRVITRVGNATLLTNLTTAVGFATFIVTDSDMLKEFGIVASLNIMILFSLSLFIIPAVYSFLPIPKNKHLEHLNRTWMLNIIHWMARIVRHKRVAVYGFSIVLLILSIIGIYKIKTSSSLLDDIPKNAKFTKDVVYFEREFGGIMPLEIVIDTHKKNGILRLSNLERMEKLQNRMTHFFKLSQPFSIVRIAKYFKQTYYNGNQEYYLLPTRQEGRFLFSYAKDFNGKNFGALESFTDTLGQVARITTYLTSDNVNRLDEIEKEINAEVEQLFPKERYDVIITGKALNFFKGTRFLIDNVFTSLILAILLISILMTYMFRSFRMVVISVIPNLLPLIITAGIMGFAGIPLKPSTVLVFGVAFGISVDDTLHFLAKYRQELRQNNWKISRSVFSALKETGFSMFYTSVVLYFGFSIFILSSFGGTKALGGLISTTLLFAMLSNLVLLPSLLLSLEKIIANKSTIRETSIDILAEDEDTVSKT